MKISPVKNMAPAWQRLIPIQSLKQLLWFVGISLACSWAGLFVAKDLLGHDLSRLAPLIFACGFAGTSSALWSHLPGRFCILADSALQAADAAQRLEAMAWKWGLRAGSGSDRHRVVGAAWPKWATWSENTLHIVIDRNTVSVTAPMRLVHRAHSRLREDMAHVLAPA